MQISVEPCFREIMAETFAPVLSLIRVILPTMNNSRHQYIGRRRKPVHQQSGSNHSGIIRLRSEIGQLMLPSNVGVNIHIRYFIPVKFLRKPDNRIRKQSRNQYTIYFLIQQITDDIIKSLVIILIEKEFGNGDVIRFHFRRCFIYTFRNSFPILSLNKRRSNR